MSERDVFAEVERLLEQPRWRGGGEKLPHREFIRRHCATPREGLVVEDLDLVLRLYGNAKGTDAVGRIRLTELKYDNRTLEIAQRRTFGILDVALRECERTRDRYEGFWLLQPQIPEPLEEFWESVDSLIKVSRWEARYGMKLDPAGEPLELSLAQFAQWVNA